MNRTDIGVDLADLGLPVKESIRTASELGFGVIELPTVEGDLAPENLSRTGRRHLLRFLAGHGLSCAALRADFPHTRLTDPATVAERLERTARVLELAADMGVKVVTASVGALTHPETGEPAPLALEALGQLADRADACGTIYALRPSQDPAGRLQSLLKRIGCPALQVCVDPAALVMAGHNPAAVVESLPDAIALAHARDATVGRRGQSGHETLLGEGEVDLIGFWATLSAAGYAGPHIARRTDSATPRQDLGLARTVLSRQLPPR